MARRCPGYRMRFAIRHVPLLPEIPSMFRATIHGELARSILEIRQLPTDLRKIVLLTEFYLCKTAALLHESELARTDPDPQFLHRPMRYDIGLPSPVI